MIVTIILNTKATCSKQLKPKWLASMQEKGTYFIRKHYRNKLTKYTACQMKCVWNTHLKDLEVDKGVEKKQWRIKLAKVINYWSHVASQRWTTLVRLVKMCNISRQNVMNLELYNQYIPKSIDNKIPWTLNPL